MGRILISSGGGGGVGSDELTATKSQVLEGTAYVGADTNDEIGQGGMANQGAKTSTLNCGQSYTIPEGYHNGSGKITANSLASQTSATAAAGHILSGKTAWVNGSKVTGNIASQGALSYTPGTSAQTASVSGKYMTGNVTIGAIPSKYKDASGATISNNNQMLSGVKAIGANGTLYTGNIASMAGGTYTPSGSTQTVSCSGKKMTSNVVINPIPSNYVNVKANQTVFNNGVCSICTRIYPRILYCMWGYRDWKNTGVNDNLFSGASNLYVLSDIGENSGRNFWITALDGTFQIGLFTKITVSLNFNFDASSTNHSSPHLMVLAGTKGSTKDSGGFTNSFEKVHILQDLRTNVEDHQVMAGQYYYRTLTGNFITNSGINSSTQYFLAFRFVNEDTRGCIRPAGCRITSITLGV